jgi:hypothetical protein
MMTTMEFRESIAVYCWNRAKHVVHSGQKADVHSIKTDGTCSDCYTSEG